MREATILANKHPNPALNCTCFTATVVVDHLINSTWWQRLRSGYKLPSSVAVFIPSNTIEVEEPLDMEFFTPPGILAQEPLNFFVSLSYPTGKVCINAAYLVQFFLQNPLLGFTEVVRLANAAKPLEPQAVPEAAAPLPEEASHL